MRSTAYLLRLALPLIIAFLGQTAGAQDIGGLGGQRPVTVNGSAELRGVYYKATGIPPDRSPYSYIFSGNLLLSIYGLSIPASFSISEQQRSFRQPFNQFGISPHYKWITVHAGYRSIVFSPYTLAGYTMLGAGVELNPGKFRFGFMYGKLASATALDTTTQSLAPFSFSRKAYALKIGVGTEKTFFDISWLRASDDPNSVPYETYDTAYRITPASNSVVGVSTRIALSRFLFVEANGAASVYTRDINSPLTFDSVDNMLFKVARKLATVNGTTDFNTALDAAIGVKTKHVSIKLQYMRIDPNFQSMGAYFFNNDLEKYGVVPSLGLFHNKVRLAGSVGIQHDNVLHQKQATASKVAANGTLGIDFSSHVGLDANFTNFSNNQQPTTIKFADSLKIAQTTQNLSVTPRYTVSTAHHNHTLLLSFSRMQLNNYNSVYSQNAASSDLSTNQYFINYTYGSPSAGLSLTLNVSSLRMQSAAITDNNNGVTLSFSKTLFKSALLVNGSAGYALDNRNSGNSGVLNLSGNATYRFYKKHGLNFLVYYTNNRPKNVSAVLPGYKELRGELAYSFHF